MTTNIRTALSLLAAAVLGVSIVAAHNHFHPAMQWGSFNEQADAIDLHNAITTCTPVDDKWVCLTFKAAMRTECTAESCGPIMEIE